MSRTWYFTLLLTHSFILDNLLKFSWEKWKNTIMKSRKELRNLRTFLNYNSLATINHEVNKWLSTHLEPGRKTKFICEGLCGVCHGYKSFSSVVVLVNILKIVLFITVMKLYSAYNCPWGHRIKQSIQDKSLYIYIYIFRLLCNSFAIIMNVGVTRNCRLLKAKLGVFCPEL
jgi:hypothetical protein